MTRQGIWRLTKTKEEDAREARMLIARVRRWNLETAVLKHINEMRALAGMRRARSLEDAVTQMVERESNQLYWRKYYGAPWLARQVRAVVLDRLARTGRDSLARVDLEWTLAQLGEFRG